VLLFFIGFFFCLLIYLNNLGGGGEGQLKVYFVLFVCNHILPTGKGLPQLKVCTWSLCMHLGDAGTKAMFLLINWRCYVMSEILSYTLCS